MVPKSVPIYMFCFTVTLFFIVSKYSNYLLRTYRSTEDQNNTKWFSDLVTWGHSVSSRVWSVNQTKTEISVNRPVLWKRNGCFNSVSIFKCGPRYNYYNENYNAEFHLTYKNITTNHTTVHRSLDTTWTTNNRVTVQHG